MVVGKALKGRNRWSYAKPRRGEIKQRRVKPYVGELISYNSPASLVEGGGGKGAGGGHGIQPHYNSPASIVYPDLSLFIPTCREHIGNGDIKQPPDLSGRRQFRPIMQAPKGRHNSILNQ